MVDGGEAQVASSWGKARIFSPGAGSSVPEEYTRVLPMSIGASHPWLILCPGQLPHGPAHTTPLGVDSAHGEGFTLQGTHQQVKVEDLEITTPTTFGWCRMGPSHPETGKPPSFSTGSPT